MQHEKALVISTTLFCEADYEADWKQPMSRIIDDWGLRYPGVKQVEHVYFYEVAIADQPRLQEYLRRLTSSAGTSPFRRRRPPPLLHMVEPRWPACSPTSTPSPVASTRSSRRCSSSPGAATS